MLTRRSLGLAAAALAAPALAEDLPDRPITVVVPWPPGGASDSFARVLTQRMAAELQRSLVIDNRGGAAGTIGMAAAARMRADGTTVVITANTSYAIAPHLLPVGYDPETAFVGVGLLASSPLVMLVPRASPFRDLADYLAAAQRASPRLAYANTGLGGTAHLAVELLMEQAGIELEAVVYRGGAPAVQAVLAGEPGMVVTPSAAALPLMQAGTMRALAATTRARSPLLPEVPTFAELGFPAIDVVEHLAMLAPAGTPEPALRALNRAAAAALRAPELQPRWQAMGLAVEAAPLDAWPAYFRAEYARWGAVVRARNIRAS